MMTTCSRKGRVSLLSIVLSILPLAIGCGGPAKSTVSGKVTYQGKAMPAGFVTFVPANGAPLHAEIQSDGSYRLNNVPLGTVKIAVKPQEGQEMPTAMPRDPKNYGKFKAAATERKSSIPDKYTDPEQSGLTYTVTQGSQQHDIDLK